MINSELISLRHIDFSEFATLADGITLIEFSGYILLDKIVIINRFAVQGTFTQNTDTVILTSNRYVPESSVRIAANAGNKYQGVGYIQKSGSAYFVATEQDESNIYFYPIIYVANIQS